MIDMGTQAKNLQNIYRLSPLQKGILFHALKKRRTRKPILSSFSFRLRVQ